MQPSRVCNLGRVKNILEKEFLWSKNHHHHGFMTKIPTLKKVAFCENFTTKFFLEQSALLPPKLNFFLFFC